MDMAWKGENDDEIFNLKNLCFFNKFLIRFHNLKANTFL